MQGLPTDLEQVLAVHLPGWLDADQQEQLVARSISVQPRTRGQRNVPRWLVRASRAAVVGAFDDPHMAIWRPNLMCPLLYCSDPEPGEAMTPAQDIPGAISLPDQSVSTGVIVTFHLGDTATYHVAPVDHDHPSEDAFGFAEVVLRSGDVLVHRGLHRSGEMAASHVTSSSCGQPVRLVSLLPGTGDPAIGLFYSALTVLLV
jgi:hypothetical protein